MTHFLTQILRVALLSILLTCSVATFAVDGTFEIETKVPATLSGKLSYASMKFWVEVSGKDAVELWFNDEDYTALMELVGTQVAFDGSMVTYTNGSVYFQPKLAKASAGFTVRKNDEVNFDVLFNGELLTHHDSYTGVAVAHQFAIPDGQVALIELFSGGVGCPVLYQLVVARQDSPTMTSEAFGTCSDLGKLSPTTNGFTLNIPGNPSERWVWDASSLTLRKSS
ncbi:hypothetical protein KAM338_27240 [Aeromonas caviae]|uniref:hypothetical protein n=1 Tax=Aeromonas hydrophila TaxID=644 RepID=UPI0004637A70|nr:hypothetical protein [Aeromonas hydrophila]BCK64780.1 hypothetical protein KAM330_37690 [Aeromonas hydrophila]GKQ62547.1 hypothetical protein KAM338_27240 [Aeromonas caviae]